MAGGSRAVATASGSLCTSQCISELAFSLSPPRGSLTLHTGLFLEAELHGVVLSLPSQKLGLCTRKLLPWLGQSLFLLLFLLSAGYWSRSWFLLSRAGEAVQLQAVSRPYLSPGKRVPEEGSTCGL